MKFKRFLIEAKMMTGTMIGLKLDQTQFKRVSDYIKSWFDRYDIDYKKTDHLHFTIAQIPGTYPKDDLIREMNKIVTNIKFNPKEITIFSGVNIKRDFIVLEYKPNFDFLENFNKIAERFEIRKFGSVRPHISLFNVEQGSLDPKLFEDIKFSLPRLPIVKSEGVELWNNKFQVEYSSKG